MKDFALGTGKIFQTGECQKGGSDPSSYYEPFLELPIK